MSTSPTRQHTAELIQLVVRDLMPGPSQVAAACLGRPSPSTAEECGAALDAFAQATEGMSNYEIVKAIEGGTRTAQLRRWGMNRAQTNPPGEKGAC